MKNIAVQKGLSNVTEYLNGQGYKVHEIDIREKNAHSFLQGFDAVVFTGMDNNTFGIESTSTKAPIIDASGMSPQEVGRTIARKLNQQCPGGNF